MPNLSSLSSAVSTPSACNQFSSSAFSESTSITNIPFFCASLMMFPEQMYYLPDPDSPANTVTLPNGMPLLKSPEIR